MPQLKLAVYTPRGPRMAIALIGRTDNEVNGTSREFLRLLPDGGPGTVTIDDPGQYDRLTAVLVNADTRATRDRRINDWRWRHDAQAINVRVSRNFTKPSVKARRPLRNTKRASTRARVTVAFSDRMYVLNSRTVKLIAPNGRAVKAKLALTTLGSRSRPIEGADKVVLTPSKRLRPRTRYEVRLSRDLRDFGGDPLPASALTWSFVTNR
jgi:hypothetical protein